MFARNIAPDPRLGMDDRVCSNAFHGRCEGSISLDLCHSALDLCNLALDLCHSALDLFNWALDLCNLALDLCHKSSMSRRAQKYALCNKSTDST